MPRAPKKYRNTDPSASFVERDIKRLQNSTKLLLPKTAFYWLVEEITTDYKWDRWHQAKAMIALQEASEAHLIEMFQFAIAAAHHAKRNTVRPEDIQLWLKTQAKK
jgi:histone H3